MLHIKYIRLTNLVLIRSAERKNSCPIIFFGSGPVLKPATTANQAGRSRARERRNGINGGDPELVEGEEAVYAGFA